MTVTAKPGEVVASDLITVFIDGTEVQVPKGTLAIRAAEMIGVAIPRFCDHPLLDPVGACRQCLVEVPDMGNGRGMPKPQASCTLECAPGMKILTQETSATAAKAQKGMIEFLLINHPLDCPICDKGGECPLQNQAMSTGAGESRYEGVKRTFPKPINISAQILLDRERCVLCARCTRFSEQISGDPFITLVERGALQQVGYYEDHPYNSYFSGNVIQICPVGALTSVSYRFQSRPFDLVSTPTTCEHCAGGCQLRTDHRHFQVKRRLAGDAPEVNEEWNCDRGRFAFKSARGEDRLTRPLVRDNGVLRVASWPEAIDAAVAGLRAAGSKVGVLTGGRLTIEDAYGYSKFARHVLGTNNIDFRARPHSDEEAAFLANRVAGTVLDSDTLSYTALQGAKQVVLVAFEPEEEAAMVFLRLRKAVLRNGTKVVTVAPYASNGSVKLKAELVATVPGAEAEALAGIEADADTIVLVGERAAVIPGLLTAAAEFADRTGARLGWIPRRAGDRGAIEAGCLPNLLPGGRPAGEVLARVDVQAAWGVESLPGTTGLDADAQLAAARGGGLALVVGGVEPADFTSADDVRESLDEASFVISLEQRQSEVTERADVVFPIALIEERPGHFLNWEHRRGRVNTVIKQPNQPMTDLRVLAALADAMGRPLGVRTARQALAELDELGAWEGVKVPLNRGRAVLEPAEGELALATWRELIDGSRSNDGEPALQATAKPVLARTSPEVAELYGLTDAVTVGNAEGWLTLPLEIVPAMAPDTVWVPAHAPGTALSELGLVHGASVSVSVPGGEA
ncbi:NADH-quinone oxidoreductase subunit G [Micropruina sonneratiae]|uniref:NADH-quinone oxidoreductase subunit G n=1 Tax=Micropruina sonneratiae TaxID=2986940 RepID=UPI002226A656|nr:NADH-quinone oxidoreductase subunit G [Micropruina sp. KQZ13P-5]MCW3158097.1 NADH-quinone oxidoreductase subunit G [Micropruina sp. KQZ13P-5]